MNRKVRAILNAVLTFAVSTLTPLMVPRILPPEALEVTSHMGFDLIGFLNKIALIGVVMTVMALMRGFVDEASPIQLGVSTASKVLWLVVFLMVLGLGRIDTMGITTLSMEMGGGVNTVTLDFQLFIYFAFMIVLLKIVHSFLDFKEARTKKMNLLKKS